MFSQTGDAGVAGVIFRPPVSGAPLEFHVTHRDFVGALVTVRPVPGRLVEPPPIPLFAAQELQGIVVDRSGQPVLGATVLAAPLVPDDRSDEPRKTARSEPPGWPGVVPAVARTERMGSFRLVGIPRTALRVWAVAEGMGWSSSAVIEPSSEGPLGPIEIVLERLPDHEASAGVVVGLDGEPAAEVLVRLVPLGSKGRADAFEFETDASGQFRFQPRERQRYELFCEDLLDRWDDLGPWPVTLGEPHVELRFLKELE